MASDRDTEPLLRVENLTKRYGGRSGTVTAVDDVGFELHRGSTLAIVGESGSGKSTLARTLLRLVEPDGGAVYYRGRDLLRLPDKQLRVTRRHIQMIFQDPYASLHPTQTTAQIISEPWKVHSGLVERRNYRARVGELLDQVGLPRGYAGLSPSRMSGGERQRIALARALALRPEILVLDEPVSALDVSIQAQIITLLMNLQQELGVAFVFISHDLSLVRLVADQVAVMYRGRFVEQGPTQEVYEHTAHPYTRTLLASSPGGSETSAGATETPGRPLVAGGCRFADRCPQRQDICDRTDPNLLAVGETGHAAACHFAQTATNPTM